MRGRSSVDQAQELVPGVVSVPWLAGRVLIAATHEHLAARCGVSRPKMSRELKQLERSGRLKLLRGSVEVLAPESFTTPRWSSRPQ